MQTMKPWVPALTALGLTLAAHAQEGATPAVEGWQVTVEGVDSVFQFDEDTNFPFAELLPNGDVALSISVGQHTARHVAQAVALLRAALHVLHQVDQVDALAQRRIAQPRDLARQAVPAVALVRGRGADVADQPVGAGGGSDLGVTALLRVAWTRREGLPEQWLQQHRDYSAAPSP